MDTNSHGKVMEKREVLVIYNTEIMGVMTLKSHIGRKSYTTYVSLQLRV